MALVFIFLANNLSQTLFTDKLTKKGMIGKNKHKLPQIEIFINIIKDAPMKLVDLSAPITYNI
ncbi:hypothetical protein BPUTSESOX_1089 [uncultured Gammaproteobacteria bacterium]|nr:hypothetical protein [uncultured Gammaproteobacteria bacterium]SSC10587.1 hypothetical protein BPUTEOSOX_527 [thiotrophic endosymbiont of Bathymodiolus puteoserpentis (Logatchev)]CAC9494416.1 hypothetical protein [uncultured Gammaproteobacteria bacterium]CAC9579895.1 hypothetical protein [uncultured Gammaproteobacteria bacterium]CAC9595064.1 hypothetical protein [uncultured Gammaproteobacteria bacterium]